MNIFRINRKIATVISVLVGLAVLAGIVYYIGLEEVVSQIQTLGWDGFLALVLIVFATFVFWTLSWLVILRGYEIEAPTGSCLAARISSFAVSYLTPSMHFGGEPVRALLIEKKTTSTYTRVFASIATERITSALSLVCFIFLGAYEGLSNQLPIDTMFYLILLGLVFAGLLLLVLLNFINGYLLFTRFMRWLKRHLVWTDLLERAEDVTRNLEYDITKAFREQRKHTIVAFLLNLIATLFMYLRPQIFFYFSQGKLFTFSEISIIFALIVLLSSFFWVTPGGLGVAEGGLIGIFALVGVEGSDAVAYSFSVKVIELLFVGFGLAWMAHFGVLNLIFARRDAEPAPESEDE